jgi:hypothetical protein
MHRHQCRDPALISELSLALIQPTNVVDRLRHEILPDQCRVEVLQNRYRVDVGLGSNDLWFDAIHGLPNERQNVDQGAKELVEVAICLLPPRLGHYLQRCSLQP